MSNFLSKIFAFSREEKRISSSEFEAAVNAALLSDTVADATKGPFISEEGALNLSAVWACVRILSETVGTLPVHLYHRTTDGRETVRNHPCSYILSKPNSYTSRFALLHHLMVSCTLWGNGYARIHRDALFRTVRLQLMHPTEVEPVHTDDDELYYRTYKGEIVPVYDMIHLRGLSTNGYKGKSPIAVHRENLSLTGTSVQWTVNITPLFEGGENISSSLSGRAAIKKKEPPKDDSPNRRRSSAPISASLFRYYSASPNASVIRIDLLDLTIADAGITLDLDKDWHPDLYVKCDTKH